MGKDWDYGVPGVSYWTSIKDVMKPGAHLLAFGGTRTHHRLMVAIEDAGFEIRDTLMWVYGTGFPKSLDVSKAIDKIAGAKREVIGQYQTPEGGQILSTYNNWQDTSIQTGMQGRRIPTITVSATEEAKQWEGWGTALKPALEPIILARKSLLEKTVAANVLKHGTGGLNIDACRVSYPDGDDSFEKGIARAKLPRADIRGGNFHTEDWSEKKHIVESGMKQEGRFPANLIHDGSDEVVELFPDRKDSRSQNHNTEFNPYAGNSFHKSETTRVGRHEFYNDDGSAARFFYCAKASKSERGEGNNHPTVKPLALMRYLCRLITPPGGVILDPFLGSGTTLLAARNEGFKSIGIDIDPQYCDIAVSRWKTSDF